MSLKFPISHCSLLTGIIPYNKQPAYMRGCNAIVSIYQNLGIKKVTRKYKLNKNNNRNVLPKNQISIFSKHKCCT